MNLKISSFTSGTSTITSSFARNGRNCSSTLNSATSICQIRIYQSMESTKMLQNIWLPSVIARMSWTDFHRTDIDYLTKMNTAHLKQKKVMYQWYNLTWRFQIKSFPSLQSALIPYMRRKATQMWQSMASRLYQFLGGVRSERCS